MTFPDLITSIGAQIKERASNPFIGAFSISWLTLNHRYVLDILSSSNDLLTKSEYLSSTYFSSYSDTYFLFNCLLFPLVSAVSIVFFYPVLNAWILAGSSRARNYLKKTVAALEGKEVFTDGQLQIANESIATMRLSQRTEVAKFKDIEERNQALKADLVKAELNFNEAVQTGEEYLVRIENRESHLSTLEPQFAESLEEIKKKNVLLQSVYKTLTSIMSKPLSKEKFTPTDLQQIRDSLEMIMDDIKNNASAELDPDSMNFSVPLKRVSKHPLQLKA